MPGSRGDLANALRLDLVVDDQFINCVEVIGAGPPRRMLMLRDPDPALDKHATDRGIGVVTSLAEALPAIVRLQEMLPRASGGRCA